MDQKLTEEQQRAAHKIIVANQGDCAKIDNYLNCHDCPKGDDESFEPCANFPGDLNSPEFQAENLRTSQAWLDAHITDDEMATDEEIAAWWNAGKGSAIHRDGISTIRPKGYVEWVPATRGNLKL